MSKNINLFEPFFKLDEKQELALKKLSNEKIYELLKMDFNEEQFVVLFALAWFNLEDDYMKNIENFYCESSKEKDYFLDILHLGEKYMGKNIKFLLIKSYIFCTCDFYFWNDENTISDRFEIKERKILQELYQKYSDEFAVCFFYILVNGTKKQMKKLQKNMQVQIKKLFPRNTELDKYFLMF